MNHDPSPFAKMPRTAEWFARASQVIPGGIYGHAAPAVTVPGRFPYYAAEGRGCRYRDLDGREFLDFMCGYGPIVLGYAHPEVDAAVSARMAAGDCFNHPTTLMVELAETLVERVDIAGWAAFGKNGADTTSWAIQTARAFTGRKKILKLKGGYHGTHPWSNPGYYGWIPEDRSHVHSFRWNDTEGLTQLAKRFRGQIAALILTPFHHPVFADSEEASADFLSAVAKLQAEGILLIMDDIRAGFRLHRGGSHRIYGFSPDLICFCKALANGYPLSALVGREGLKNTASKVFMTGSYWNSAGPMAAALTCLSILDRDEVIVHLDQMGMRLREGLCQAASSHGLQIIATGPAAVPTFRLADDPSYSLFQNFCAACADGGVFFHPHHNWFLCASHGPAEIDQAVAVAEVAFNKITQ